MHIRCATFFRLISSRKPWPWPSFKGIRASMVLAFVASILSVCFSSFGARHEISVTPTAIDFGNQPINTSTPSPITVTNSGSHTLQIQSISLAGSSAFTLTGWTGQVSLAPEHSLQLGVIFNPTAQSNYSATITIYSNAFVDPVVRITGAGIASGISISPPTAVVLAGSSQQFTVTNSANTAGTNAASTNTAVSWMVNGMPGGNSTVGTVSGNGLYTAPSDVSSNSSVMVTAANGTSQANASVTIVPAQTAVTVSISPTSATVRVGLTQQFTPTVTGTTNTAVNWLVSGIAGGNSTVGTISSTGLYTAPSSVPTSGVTITGQSAYQPASSANATVTVLPAVTVSISPTSATVQVGLTQQFTPTVTGTTNTAVNWLVSGIAGGNSTVGTISSTGLYTAPSSVPTSTVTITAQSAYQSTISANATVTVRPASVTVSISPTSATVQVGLIQQFTPTVTGTTNTAVNWLVSGIPSGNSTVGTISSTGLYTAPSSVPTNAVTITAQSAYQSTSSASATVTVTPLSFVDLSWTASTSSVTGYNIYRTTVSGGPYTKLNPSLLPGTTYTDSSVQGGQTYYYVTTAVDSSGVESAYSNEASATIP